MITNTGKNILAKYLLGQAPAYASYIALGCGAKPLASDGVLDDYSDQERLNFEMFRVPIISRGYVSEDDITKLVLTAELPSEERYEITEVGIFSAGSNTSAGAYDSKSIYAFTQDENWEYHTQTAAVSLPIIYEPLDSGSNPPNNIIGTTKKVFQTNADNRIFTNENRSLRYERCRFFNNIVVLRGDLSGISTDLNNHLVINSDSEHLHLTGASLDFNRNAPTDEIKLAFSVINKDGGSNAVPDKVKIVVEFASSDIHNTGEWARLEIDLGNGTSEGQHDFATNRYVVSTKQLQELYKSTGFTWSQVDVVKFYVSVIKGTALVSNKSATATTVTLTTSANHSFSVGDKIVVNGLGNSGRFDGIFEILEVTPNTIKYSKAGEVVSSTAVSPTVTVERLRDDFYVCLDAIRLENNSTANPLYGMSGYSVIKNLGAQPIIKLANTTNYIEFRFALDVQ